MSHGSKQEQSLRQLKGERVAVAAHVLEAMQSAAHVAHPCEACGILLGEGGQITAAHETSNVHPSPETHFEIDPQALIAAHREERAGGPCVIGYFHSHPTGDPRPSATDRAMAAHDGKVWAIIGGGEICFWRDGADGFAPLSYEVTAS